MAARRKKAASGRVSILRDLFNQTSRVLQAAHEAGDQDALGYAGESLLSLADYADPEYAQRVKDALRAWNAGELSR